VQVFLIFQSMVASAQVLPSINRIDELLAFPEIGKDEQMGLDDVPPVTDIQFRHVSFAYAPGKNVLNRFDLAIEPGEKIAVMGPKGAVEIIFRSELGDKAKIEAKTKEYTEKFANPFVAASRGFIDEVIMPHSTRRRIARGLRMLRDKELENPWKKHDNIPL